MESHAAFPHARIPVAHTADDAVSKIFHEDVMEHRPGTTEDAGELDRIVNVRNYAH